MPEFAEYSIPSDRLPSLVTNGLVVRTAALHDLDAVAAISARREGVEVARQLEGLRRSFGRPDHELWVASVGSRIVGFGRSALFRPPADAPPNCIPEGWHLGGVVVSPEFRRRGVALELTRRRLDRIFGRAALAYYYAAAINRVTIELHARLGFRERTRDFWVPGTSFTGGVGILFELGREEYATWDRDDREGPRSDSSRFA